MKLTEFSSEFKETKRENSYAQEYEEVGESALLNLTELRELFEIYPGVTFNQGLFKIHTRGSSYLWTKLTFQYFEKFKGNSYCFAFDWLGRQYAVNYFKAETKILILDPADAEAYEIEKNIGRFLNEDIVENKDYIFNVERYEELIEKFHHFKFEECLGFKQFLFLGGEDVDDNLEITDMEVYWELNRQIYLQTRNLPPGTKINLSI